MPQPLDHRDSAGTGNARREPERTAPRRASAAPRALGARAGRTRLLGLVLGACGLALVLLWAGWSVGAAQPRLTRGPYVMSPTTNSITIAWHTDLPADGRVDYGTGPVYGSTVSAPGPAVHHGVTVTGLAADTTYAYRVGGGGRVLAEGHTFRTSRDETNPHFSFVVLGDSGQGEPPQYAIAHRIGALRPDFVLHTGDVIYPSGEAKDFDAKYFRPYRHLLASIPFFLALGNHDVVAADGQAYLEFFHLPSNNPARTKRYYSFDYGNARFIALDTNQPPGPGSPFYAWLVEELGRSPKFWTFVFFHHPPYSSGGHGSALGVRQAWGPLFERAGVAAVFSGHDHIYERTVPVREFDAGSPGVVYVVTGGGGAPMRRVGRSAWTAHSASVHHVVRGEVRDCVFELQAVNGSGGVFDRTAIDRCGAR